MFFFNFLNVNTGFLLFADTCVLATRLKSVAINKLKAIWMAQRLKWELGVPGQGDTGRGPRVVPAGWPGAHGGVTVLQQPPGRRPAWGQRWFISVATGNC